MLAYFSAFLQKCSESTIETGGTFSMIAPQVYKMLYFS